MNEDFKEYDYSVAEATGDDATGFRIEKKNIKADFTIAEMRSAQAKCEKMIKELAGTLKLEESKAENIRTHHPHVLDMTMEQLFACKMYYESMALIETLPAKISEMQEALDESKAEEAHIIEVLGLTFPEVVPTVEEVVDNAMQNIQKGEPAIAEETQEVQPEAPAE